MLLALAVRSILLLVLAFLIALSLRRASAALRHMVWIAAFACLLVLPFLQRSAPQWGIAVPAAASPVMAVVMAGPAPAAPVPVAPSHHFDFVAVWYAGIALALVRLLLGFVQLQRIRAQSRPAPWSTVPSRTAAVLESDRIDLPITFGVFRPTIVFPGDARTWPAERRRLVLAHELAHVRRFDCLTQLLAEAACALYWFNPLAWLAAAQSRKERERACDDAVLVEGAKSSDYAEHLLGVVKSVQTKGAPVAMALSFNSHDLQERLKAVLKPHVSRRGATPRLAAVILVLALSIAIPIATMHAQSPSNAALAGSVLDVSGAAVPHAMVTANGLDTHNREVAFSGEDGTYSFRSLPAGRYTIEVRARGFAVFSKQVVVAAGQPAALNPSLNLGTVTEALDVVGQRPSSSTPAAPRAMPQRIRVGGNVQAVKLTYRVPPVYPEHAKQNGIEGVVVLQGVIGTNGNLLSIEALSKSVDPELVQAARDAVSQWRYEPTLLNGQPVEVITTITVNFRLE